MNSGQTLSNGISTGDPLLDGRGHHMWGLLAHALAPSDRVAASPLSEAVTSGENLQEDSSVAVLQLAFAGAEKL